jgi:hypothetical protein
MHSGRVKFTVRHLLVVLVLCAAFVALAISGKTPATLATGDPTPTRAPTVTPGGSANNDVPTLSVPTQRPLATDFWGATVTKPPSTATVVPTPTP